MASSSSSSKSTEVSASPPPPPPQSPVFERILERERREENEEKLEEDIREGEAVKGSNLSTDTKVHSKHHPTPLHAPKKTPIRKHHESDEDDRRVSCNKCRPSAREKISVVPLDGNGSRHSTNSSPNPNNIFKAIFSSLTRKSPKSSESSAREEQWKLAFTELSQKLLQVTRKRDEALLEASRLKYSMSELEKKLNKLEIYCHDLKSALETCTSSSNPKKNLDPMKHRGIASEVAVESFLRSVSDARNAVRHLSRCLTVQLRQQMTSKVMERLTSLLQPYEVKISISKNPRSLLFYLEALLNRAFHEEFEGLGFQKNGSDLVLDPIERCEANFASYTVLKGLSWDEVLTKGTRHFSEEFSKFCDRKMSEIVAMLGWNRAWPEPLLQAFFGAAKCVWLVHLLARAVHPSLPIFRVERGARFDGGFMEDMVGEKVRKLTPTTVRIMVAPGFYVFSSVVKCKVLCRYNEGGTTNVSSS